MPNFTKEQLREVMGQPANIRNMSVIAHVDHGKSTLTDSLVQKAGIISKQAAGVDRHTDTREDEAERGITIKSTGVSMAFQYKQPGDKESKTYAVNLIDSPGHVDFSSEVTAALRVTDGALVVVDCVEGVCVQTETVLRQAVAEKVRPVLMLNKMDRIFLELKMDPMEAYRKFRSVIEDVNVILAEYTDPDLGEIQLDPRDATVAFGSGYHQWAFTLRDFARINAKKMCPKDASEEDLQKQEDKLMKFLWGDYYYDPKKKAFTNKKPDGVEMNVFCQLVMKPIKSLIEWILSNQTEKYEKVIASQNIKLSDAEAKETERKLAKAVMRNWLPASECLLKMIIEKLPSPVEAQSYRAKYLYTGPSEGPTYEALAKCDPEGPVMMYVSKMVPVTEGSGQFYAFGRLFSGTIRPGEKYKIMGGNYVHGKKTDLHQESPQRVVTLMAAKADSMESIPCGNTCALVGMRTLVKTGTISSDPEAHPIRDMKFAVAPVVQKAVGVKDAKLLPKMIEGLNRLRKSDPACRIFRDSETGENVVAGTGELHLEILLNDLSKFMNGAELNIKDPIVAYRETIVGTTEKPIFTKSANKHNHFYVSAEPLPDGVAEEIEAGNVVMRPKDEVAQRRYLVEKYGMDPNDLDPKRMYGFGPTDKDPNMYVNASSGVQYLDQVKDSIHGGFCDATAKGPLCGEPVCNVMFKYHDGKFHGDSVHRGIGQVGPASRRACQAALLNAEARLMEPIYLVGINVPTDVSGSVYGIMASRRGEVIDNSPQIGTPMTNIKAYLPVAESFGFDSELRGQTAGKGFAQCTFSHYKVIEDDPYEEGSLSRRIIDEIRTRKKIGALPSKDHYQDRD